MTMLAGIDFSTHAIDVAIIPLDDTAAGMPPPTFRTAHLAAGDDRLRSVRDAMYRLLASVGTETAVYEVTSVWVEEPIGRYRNADRALLPIYGAILATIPTAITAAGISTLEWRRTLNLPTRLSKADAIDNARAHLELHGTSPAPLLTEHEADALLIALAGRALCWEHAA